MTRGLVSVLIVALGGDMVPWASVASAERIAAAPVPIATFLFTPTVLEQTRQGLRRGELAGLLPAYGALIRAARSATPATGSPWDMSTGPWSVMNKTIAVPKGVSRHDYLSIGIYNHPCNALPPKCKAYPGGHLLPPADCDHATGLPWEPCDGIRNLPAIAEGDALRQGHLVNAVSTLTMAAFLCADRDGLDVTPAECASWANRTATILRVWFLDDATKMEPNLAYGQIMPSKKAPAAGHGGFIEWAHTPVLLDMVAILRSAAPEIWTTDDHTAFGDWLGRFLLWVDSKTAAGERNMANNHGTWYDSTWQAVALHAGNTANASAAVDEVKHRRIDRQILWNGHEWIELERANNCGYCQYNLLALTHNAAQAANQPPRGEDDGGDNDLWGYVGFNGSSIRKVADWLLPYATGKAKWPYSQNSDTPSWGTMYECFRFASVAYNSEAYERAACLVEKAERDQRAGAGARDGGDSARGALYRRIGSKEMAGALNKDLLNLLVPPVYSVDC